MGEIHVNTTQMTLMNLIHETTNATHLLEHSGLGWPEFTTGEQKTKYLTSMQSCSMLGN